MRKKPRISYFNDIITFDIESTNYVEYKNVKHRDGTVTKEVDKKYAWMYMGDFCRFVCGNPSHYTIRTWEEAKDYVDLLSNSCQQLQRYVIWVHNLSFEFQFMKDWFKFTEVFCRKAHNVIRCVYRNIEFRDSLALANCKLEKLAKNEKLPVQKLVGDLDYNLIRHYKTPITDKEMGYQWNDTEIVGYYIQKKLKEYGSMAEIPMTSTGEVRYLFRKELSTTLPKIHDLAVKYTATTKELQNLLVSIYSGAYTHCNYQAIDRTLYHLRCRDIASSYPYQMVARKFPTMWFKLKRENEDNFDELFTKWNPDDYAWVMTVKVWGLKAKHCHNTLSLHKAKEISKEREIDNGRVAIADYACYDMNETDFLCFLDFYNFDHISIENVYVSKKEYLPKELVSVILKLFQQKTALKGVKGEEENYMRSKNRINGVYGTSVFNFLASGVYFDEESNYLFGKDEKSFADYKKYMANPNQYLWYSIGVWVTSYARRQILTPIKRMSENAIYSDTDSVKYIGGKRYDKLWERLNNSLKTTFLDAMKYHEFTENEYRFFDKDGKEYFMGIFEEEEPYYRFKSLGSKRYLVEYYNHKLSTTVAGAPKSLWQYLGNDNDTAFRNFTNNFKLPNCKLTHTYTENNCFKVVTDYLGNMVTQEVRSGVCLSPADFSMKLDEQFFDFLVGKIEFENKDIYQYFLGQMEFKK